MKRMLVALDDSPRAANVLAAAEHLADLTGAKLVLFHAIAVPIDVPAAQLVARDLDEQLRLGARSGLDKLVKRPELVEARLTEFATAWDGICRAAKTHECDLIVIGSHGYGGLDRLLGTTAGKVVNHADRNVLVVRATL